ncbi:MAG: hypothetical protein GDA56_30575 [Hormoscilla sp. GM7CHS1pb]|nr:hypothetical protein [Hormoscilla sp. GM7CHS1pb]
MELENKVDFSDVEPFDLPGYVAEKTDLTDSEISQLIEKVGPDLAWLYASDPKTITAVARATEPEPLGLNITGHFIGVDGQTVEITGAPAEEGTETLLEDLKALGLKYGEISLSGNFVYGSLPISKIGELAKLSSLAKIEPPPDYRDFDLPGYVAENKNLTWSEASQLIKKVGEQLAWLYASDPETITAVIQGTEQSPLVIEQSPLVSTDLLTDIYIDGQTVRIRARAEEDGDQEALLEKLKALGLQNGNAYDYAVYGSLPISKIGEAAKLESLLNLWPVYKPINIIDIGGPIIFEDIPSAPEEVIQLKITPSELTEAVEPNTNISFDVNYSTEPAETPTTGIAFGMHWDSSQVAFDPVTGLTERFSLGAQPISAVLDDPVTNGGLDGDPNTDKYILQAWVDEEGNWPNNSNLTLYKANFTALPGFEETQINFSANPDHLPANSNFVPSSIALTSPAPSPALDIDGNGVIDALTDGLVAIRYLFGFRGETLTEGVVGEGATRNTEEIVAYLDEVGDTMLDVDGNGTAGALTDGILFMRHALGFEDQALIEGAVSPDATRTTAEAINAHLQSFSL